MHSISDLADAAVRAKQRLDKSASWKTAVITAIKGKGILSDADIKRRTPQVLAELGRRGNLVARSRHAQAH